MNSTNDSMDAFKEDANDSYCEGLKILVIYIDFHPTKCVSEGDGATADIWYIRRQVYRIKSNS